MRLRVAVVLLIATCSLSAQRAPEPIALDVVVDGISTRQPLTAADFQVSEAGEVLPVVDARLVQPPPAAMPLPARITDENEEAAASSAARLVAIYVDEYHLADEAAFTAARSALAAFVRNDLGPQDLVVVLKPLDSLLSIRMSADREAAAQVIEGAVPRLGDYTARSEFEQDFIAGAPARIDAARNQIAWSSVSALTTHLGRFPAGRKTLIVMSNGVSATPAVPRREQFLPGLDSIARIANRERVSVYLVQPTAAVAAQTREVAGNDPQARDPLALLAQQTTGFVIGGRGSVAAGLARIAAEASRYYLLTLAPVDRPADGRFRTVDISVRRPGAVVRGRAGYVVKRIDPAPSGRPAIPEGMKVPRRSSALIRAWFGQSMSDDGGTRVDFVWEPAPRVPGGGSAIAAPSRVSMTVTTLDGAPVFTGTTSASGRDAVIAAGQRPQLSFDARPGQLLVQMDILDASGKVVDHEVRDLVITPFREPLGFGTAAVFRARTMPALRAVAEGRTDAAPVASRQFSRAEQLLVRVPVVSRDAAGATVTAQLESRFGSRLRDIAVTRVSPSIAEVQLPLAGLASGGYALAFEARSDTATARARLEFVVTP